jgi:hypothetical protein
MALNGTMVKIETVTVGSGGQAAIEFTSIPQTYTDLKIVISGRSSSTPAEGMYIAFNGSTSNFSGRYLIGDGANASSGVLARYVGSIFGAVGTANVFNNTEVYIPNYTSSNNKSFSVDNVAENNATTGYQNLIAGLWSSSSAITSISITCTGFTQHTTATLYGISRTTAQIKATGGMVYDDASFVYHLFTASGTFTPTQTLSCDVLVIAGGGAGGCQYAGGGGAGGVAYQTARSVSASAMTVTVGAGGASVSATGNGNTGSNSVFDTITANGGGGGAAWNTTGSNGLSGGSGGGGSMGTASGNTTSGGTATQSTSGGATGYGNNGGGGLRNNPVFLGGGGGGAGVVGGTASGTVAGNGGNGLDTWSTWATATSTGVSGFYAGGGGGSAEAGTRGSGGSGGGGLGALFGTTSTGGNGTTNTGSGGGAAINNGFASGSGGSGIVIVRYAK